jgi:hypothetical protein
MQPAQPIGMSLCHARIPSSTTWPDERPTILNDAGLAGGFTFPVRLVITRHVLRLGFVNGEGRVARLLIWNFRVPCPPVLGGRGFCKDPLPPIQFAGWVRINPDPPFAYNRKLLQGQTLE